ncbi:LCP family protein [Ligilactobacillus apodemi]|uniref:LCP family glycopolymer transferase n=1 Tax=Ligilactobacillus apodemi TaxID=307126 RepID=UPI00214BFC4B|nr:LCP family protein [Ligilactobacillus apodemi]MCR1902198.1 LCP family protein [Ligilactobacillus apodemi]
MNNENNPRSRRGKSHSHAKSRDPRLRKRICLGLLVLTLFSFFGVGAYLYNILNSAKSTLSKTYSSSKVTKSRNVSSVLKKNQPISILLLGTDTGDLGRSDTGRTDTIIVATINPSTKTTTLTSLPRDTKVTVPGSENAYDKLNSAYTIGGVSTAIKTVQNTLDIPIDFYVLVNMRGLKQLVNAVGGITITPTLTFEYGDVSVTKGKTVTLNGKQALSYARMRYDDPLGDYGRQKRQRQVITAIANKALSASGISNYQKIFKTLGSNMQTDLTYDDIITLVTNYKDAAQNIKSYTLQGQDATIDGLSYQVASAAEKKRISNKIRKQLGLKNTTKTFEDSDSSSSSDDDSYGSYSSGSYGSSSKGSTGSGSSGSYGSYDSYGSSSGGGSGNSYGGTSDYGGNSYGNGYSNGYY